MLASLGAGRLRCCVLAVLWLCCRAEHSCVTTTLYAFIGNSLPLAPIWHHYFAGAFLVGAFS